jgi:hypothetical protein
VTRLAQISFTDLVSPISFRYVTLHNMSSAILELSHSEWTFTLFWFVSKILISTKILHIAQKSESRSQARCMWCARHHGKVGPADRNGAVLFCDQLL